MCLALLRLLFGRGFGLGTGSERERKQSADGENARSADVHATISRLIVGYGGEKIARAAAVVNEKSLRKKDPPSRSKVVDGEENVGSEA
jgi:hypothetical protein